jgi:hypothetical protein
MTLRSGKGILRLLDQLGLTRSDVNEFARLRKIRGRLLRRPMSGGVAFGRARAGDRHA